MLSVNWTGKDEMKHCVNCSKNLFGLESQNRWSSDTFHQEWNNQPICDDCFRELLRQQHGVLNTPNTLTAPEAAVLNCRLCHFFSKKTVEIEKASLTNLMGAITGSGVMDYDYVDQYSCSKFEFDLTNKLSLAGNCSSYITEQEYQDKCLKGEMEKRNVQIILDFSSLKDVMSKGGVIMTAYNCPKCNGMVDLPESGKILICKYCGTPIKPVDIFEKIKSLI